MLAVGEIIRTNREQLEISQECLSHGICSVSNLSRIESGSQIPSRITYEALMQRMGLSPAVYPSFLNDRELEAHKLKYEISDCVGKGDFAKAEELMERLVKEPMLDKLYTQYIAYVKALIFRHRGGDPQEALSMMKQVLDMSIKDFEPKKILRLVLTKDELFMLCHYAIAHKNAGDLDSAIEIQYSAKEYIEKKVVDTAETASAYTMILFALSKSVMQKDKFTEALELCDIGLAVCLKYGKLYSFSDILFNKGYALIQLGRVDEAQKYIQESYYIDRAANRALHCDITKSLADEHGLKL